MTPCLIEDLEAVINIQRSIKHLLKEWGHDVYIQRILPNGNYSDQFEKVTTRSVGKSGLRILKAGSEEFIEGVSYLYDAIYYFESNVNPKEGDRIYEDYSTKSNSNYTRFLMKGATAVRGKFGKINYWVVGCERE